MKRILKKGEVPKNPIVRFKCDYCGTEFEADANGYESCVGTFESIPFRKVYISSCPLCGETCYEDHIYRG